jgi:hypothetical protein
MSRIVVWLLWRYAAIPASEPRKSAQTTRALASLGGCNAAWYLVVRLLLFGLVTFFGESYEIVSTAL